MVRRLPRSIRWVLVLAASGTVLGLLSGVSPTRSGNSPGIAEKPRDRATPAPAPVALDADRAVASRPRSLSCKPSPPVAVSLVAGPTASAWTVRLEALEPADGIVVTMGGTSAGQDLASTTVWRGSLEQGEERRFEVRFTVPAGADAVWVESAAGAPGAIQRGRAALAFRDGRAMSQLAGEPPGGRVVTDPQSGLPVVEYEGGSGGER